MSDQIFSRARRRFLKKALLTGIGYSLLPGAAATLARGLRSDHVANEMQVDFLWSGGVTTEGFVVRAGMSEDGEVRLAVSSDENWTNVVFSAPAMADSQTNNRMVPLAIDGLQPDTVYYYAIEYNGSLVLNRIGTMKTFPAGAASFTFACASCAQTGSNRRVFETIANLSPLFMLHMGDMHYENIDVNDRNIFRAAYEEVLSSPRQAALYQQVPLVYMWDDHDFGPNNGDRESPSREAALLTYREYVPHYPLYTGAGTEPIYQAFTVGRVRFILTDLRSERTPADEPDVAGKSMMGTVQKDWFKQELLQASNQYALVVWVNTVPWIYEPENGSDRWGGYTDERRELANFISQNAIGNLVMLSGDAHMLAADDGTNNTYANGGAPGFPVMHAAALDSSPSEKGGPYSEGAYPGRGQFGLVTVEDNGSSIQFRFSGQDEDGNEIVSLNTSITPLGTAGEPVQPQQFQLMQNFPNPFNGGTTIRYYLQQSGPAKLELFNMQGQPVKVLVNRRQAAGWHEVQLQHDNLSSGIYFYRLGTVAGSAVRRMHLLK